MSQLTPVRRRAALLALALGGFAIGSTEFVAMGLLPNIAHALLPGLMATNPNEGLDHAGWLVSAYALGVVVGAPTIAATSTKLPRKRLLVYLLIAFTVMTIASALMPTFGLVLVARFAAGLPHGAYFGVASLVAADMMGPGKRARGVAMVLSGLSVANIFGVPAITWIGQSVGWRAAYGVVAALFAVTFVAVATLLPSSPAEQGASLRRELGAFRQPQVWITMALGAVGFGGFFAVYSYLSPLVVHGAGLPESAVPVVLIVVGIGMTIGNMLGGHFADVNRRATILAGLIGLICVLIIVVFITRFPVGVFIAAFLLGLSSLITPAVQARLMDVAGDAQTLGAALNHSAFNVGNSVGAALGGAAIAAGFGYHAPAWIGAGLAFLGLMIALFSYGLERRTGQIAPFDTGTGSVPTAPIGLL